MKRQFFGALLFIAALAAPLHAQQFAHIDSLFFTKPFGGANPLPQVLSVASTGNAFDFSVSASTSSGGNWLSVSPSGFCCTTPAPVSVVVNASANLAAGTYTGQVLLTSGASISQTVPVTLVVAPPTGAFFDNTPGQLSFFMKPNGQPPSQTLQIRNAGTGTLSWNLTKSTFNGGNFLNVSASSGTAPSTITVGIVPANLPNGGATAGTYTGQLLFQTPGSSITVPISVTVGNNVWGQVNPLSFTKPFAGLDPLSQVITGTSTGSAYDFTVTAATGNGGAWLKTSPTGFCCTTPRAVTVNVTADITLAAGSYTGQVVLTGASMAMVIPVNLTIGPAGGDFFDNPPGQLSFSLQPSAGAPPPQLVQIRDAGTGTLNWTLTATTFDSGNWLTVSPQSSSAPALVTVGIIPQNLPSGGLTAGVYVANLLFQASGSSVTVPITVQVGAGFAQTNGLNFTKLFAGANPLPQTITIASTGAAFDFTVASDTATGGNWLTVSPSGFCCTTPRAITVTVNAPASLAAGTYTGEVIVYGPNTSMTVPVTLTVAAPGSAFLDNLPGQLSFTMGTGGHPPSQVFQIRNGGSGSLNWNLTASTFDGGSWLNVSPTSGSTPAQITVGISPQNLPNAGLVAGTFTGQILIQAGGSSATIPIKVDVGPNVFGQVNGIDFVMPLAGANPLPQTLTITAGVATDYTVTFSTATGGNWLTVSPTGFCCTTPEVLTVGVNAPAGLAAGMYTGQVVVTSGNAAMTIPVTLTVASPGSAFFDNIQGQVSFSGLTGATVANQTIQLRGLGGGQLNWTVSPMTFDGGNWLTVSPTSGTATSTVTVGISMQNLPSTGLVAGTFTGQLLFQTDTGSMTVPVSVNLGPNVFAQAGTLSFTMPFGGSNPLAQTLTVAGTGTGLEFTATGTSGNGGHWLTISPNGFCCTTPRVITFSVNGAGLPAGVYTGQAVFNRTASAMTVPVILTVQGTTSLNPTSANAVAAGGPASVAVTASGSWTAVSNAPWIVITAGASGTGNGTVNYSVSPIDSTNQRVGTMTIAGQTFTVTQAGASFTLNPTSANLPVAGGPGTVSVTSTSPNVAWTAVSNSPFITVTSGANGMGNGAVGYSVAANGGSGRSGSLTIAGQTFSITQAGTGQTAGLQFVPVTPCRVMDTRNPTGPLGGPAMLGQSSRSVPIPSGACNIPGTALAYSLNITVVPRGPLQYLSIWPSGQPQPVVSTLNAFDGRIVANAAIVPAGTNGAISVFVSDTTDVIIDINGYFAPASTPNSLSFYSVTPCRVVDTRNPASSLGGPLMSGGSIRSFPIPSSSCGVPNSAAAYSFNVTVVPRRPLGYLTTWPTGQPQPVVSTLNSGDGSIVANAAIVPAGTNGAVSFFVTDDTDVIIDVNGYFAAPGSPAAQALYTVSPCRVADTRGGGFPSGFGSPAIAGGASRSFQVPAGPCPGIPGTAKAYSLNVTVVPSAGVLGYLTAWPTGQAQPVVSTLNSPLGKIVANAAIVPSGTSGAISVFVTDLTNVILDINAYFAP